MIPGIVNAGGEVVALGRRFWSPELYSKRGWEVELHFDQGDEMYPSVWTKGRQHRLCTAGQVADTGFADLDGARSAASKTKEHRASVVRWQVAEILNVLDQRFERAGHRPQSFGPAARHDGKGSLVRRLRNAWKLAFQQGEVSAEKPAHDVDLDLERIEAILLHGETLFDSHLNTPEAKEQAKASAERLAAHRLCEGSK